MKKETRVKDLKLDLIKLLVNEVSFSVPFRDVLESNAMPFLKLINWQNCTDAERLAYCEVRYPKGTKFKSAWRNFDIGFVEFYKVGSDGWIYCSGGYSPYPARYVYANGKFAEIIEEVEMPEVKAHAAHGNGGLNSISNVTDESKFKDFTDKLKKESIKDRLKGTCVLNESVEMGAEIVALYTEARFENAGSKGSTIGAYYGIVNNRIYCGLKNEFDSVLTLDQLREIVRGEKQTVDKDDYEIIALIPQYIKDYYNSLDLNDRPANTKTVVRELKALVELVEGKNYANPVEFKDGEVVEYTNRTFDEFINDGSTFTGGRTRNGNYILQRKGEIFAVMHIRKIDPDKELKEIAKPILEYWGLMEDGKCDPNVLCAMVEAMKKVQSKK